MKKKITLFEIFNYTLLLLLALIAILPFLNVLAKSMSSARATTSGQVFLLPVEFQLETYKYILFESQFIKSLGNTLFVTTLGTILAMIFTVLTAYPLSRPHFKGKKFFTLLYIFSMVFYGGMVPSYILMKTLNLIDTIYAMIIPFLVVPFNMLVIKSYFENLPDSVEESAKIDGAGDLRILWSIMLPMSKPVLASVSLFYVVAYWNNYFHPMLFIDSPHLKPLQLFLYDTVKSPEAILEQFSASSLKNISIDGVVSTTVICATIPVIILYPFVQRYFMAGMTIGAVKG